MRRAEILHVYLLVFAGLTHTITPVGAAKGLRLGNQGCDCATTAFDSKERCKIPMTTPSSSTPTDSYTASEWTQQSMFSDLLQQKGLIIGAGVIVGLFLLLRGRSRPEEKAARKLVRDWRNVDDPGDVRDLLGENLPPIIRPALLMVLAEVERQIKLGFRRVERQIERL